jgi:hypothetical protein
MCSLKRKSSKKKDVFQTLGQSNADNSEERQNTKLDLDELLKNSVPGNLVRQPLVYRLD